MTDQYPHSRILIFIKNPIVGQVKTRLMPDLTAEQACSVYQQLLVKIFTTLKDSHLCPIDVYCTPNLNDSFIHKLTAYPQFKLYLQVEGDLGTRMQQAAKQSLKQADQVLLIGADCPIMSADYLQNALEVLSQQAVVISPSEDGGYVLLGLKDASLDLFNQIDWGTDKVFKSTLQRLKSIKHQILPMLWDLDDYNDLKRWQNLV